VTSACSCMFYECLKDFQKSNFLVSLKTLKRGELEMSNFDSNCRPLNVPFAKTFLSFLPALSFFSAQPMSV
jgi:hypothetical protein